MSDDIGIAPGVASRPGVRYGEPCIKGTGIPPWVIAERFRAGDSVLHLATEYGLGAKAIENALRYEGWCRPPEAELAYDEGLIRTRLREMLTWTPKGCFVRVQAEMLDVEDGLRAAAQAGVISGLELNVLILRLVQGLGRRQAAALLTHPVTGGHPSPDVIKHATVRGVRKIADWLNLGPV